MANPTGTDVVVIGGGWERTAEAVLLCGQKPDGTLGIIQLDGNGNIIGGTGGGGGGTITLSGDVTGSGSNTGTVTTTVANVANFTLIGGTLLDSQLPADLQLTDPLVDSIAVFNENLGVIQLPSDFKYTGSTTSGGVPSGGSVAINLGTVTPPTKFVVGDTIGTSPRGIMEWQSSSDVNGAHFHLRKSRGTFAAPTVVSSQDILGRIVFAGYDSLQFNESAYIRVLTVGTSQTASRLASQMDFWTTPDAASSTPLQAMSIGSDQSVNVGVAGSVLGKLNISGNTSGTISILPQAAAGTWNFNLPITAGSSGQVLTSQGGGSTAMTWTSAGTGTVTHTGGNLTSNSVVLGAGTADVKVVSGIVTDGNSQLKLGVQGTTTGSVQFFSAGTGTLTLTVPAGSLGSATLTLPDATDTLVANAYPAALTNKSITLSASASSVAPLVFTSGGNLTSPSIAGGFEYDGNVFYSNPASNQRGISPSYIFIRSTSNYNLANRTNAQQLFNQTGAASGQVSVAANTSYRFKCAFAVASLSSSSSGVGFALGGTATISNQAWYPTAGKIPSLNGGGAANVSYQSAASNNVTTSTTNTSAVVNVDGVFSVTLAGTIIPQVSMVIAAAGVVQAGAFFECWPLGTDTMTSVGNWS